MGEFRRESSEFFKIRNHRDLQNHFYINIMDMTPPGKL